MAEQSMLDFIKNTTLERYIREYQPGEALFEEGDPSQDMYILVTGSLEVYKFDRIITEVDEPGTLVGEMSYLLGSGRTATVKAATLSTLVCIASDDIPEFLKKYPEVAPHVAAGLARRLDETTHVIHGLKEFADQLPDAVIMTSKEMEVMAWNRAAEKLLGLTWREVRGCPLADLFAEHEEYLRFSGDVLAGRCLHEQVHAVKHPVEGERFVSTSTTVLYDSHHNVGGFIFLSRDVTGVRQLEEKYRRIRNSLLPVFALLVILMIGALFAVPRFSEGLRLLDQQQTIFQTRVSSDARSLAASLSRPLAAGDTELLTALLRSYFSVQNPRFHGIKGVALLDSDKKVIAAHVADDPELVENLIGSSYSGITFQGDGESAFRVLVLFRPDKNNSMGAEGIEVAYGFSSTGGPAAWLLFLLDLERLQQGFGLEAETLKKMKF